jgi:hypothetical protein
MPSQHKAPRGGHAGGLDHELYVLSCHVLLILLLAVGSGWEGLCPAGIGQQSSLCPHAHLRCRQGEHCAFVDK